MENGYDDIVCNLLFFNGVVYKKKTGISSGFVDTLGRNTDIHRIISIYFLKKFYKT